MKRIAVASRNPVKLNAALGGFRRTFPDEEFEAEPVEAPSGVREQPRSSAEALEGARHRARAAARAVPDADFHVGIEGGIEETEGEMAAFAWIVVRAGDGTEGKGRSGTFFLPDAVAELVREGRELGEADDLVFGRENSKQRDGAIGILTGNVLDRTRLYEHAVILALARFKSPEAYARHSVRRSVGGAGFSQPGSGSR
jgi:inosine/xanthosine triphosphatase